MPATIVIGAQWGDEGKGKLIDVLSSQMDFVVRYQGGANAGHTLKVKKEEVVLHLIPSAVFHPQVKCLISSGVALDIEALCEEIKILQEMGKLKEPHQLLISDSATLLLDHHKQLDQARENPAYQEKIGTTGKGIGPAYESRAARKALVFSDLFEEDDLLLAKLKERLRESHFLLSEFYKQKPVSAERILQKIKKYRDIVKIYRCKDISSVLYKALQEGKKVLFEGAQGSLLDVLYGTYPYVTSSSTLAGGALSSCGLGFQDFTKTIAITKAYTTRVGSGPFPTECSDEPAGIYLQNKGKEFGATTGRTRRCGWLDLVALKYSLRINGVNSLALMKLDVLSGLKEIKVCVAYKIGSKIINHFPRLLRDFDQVKPIYKVFPSWNQDLSSIQSKEKLPKEALHYIDFISKELRINIDIISVGPARAQTFFLKNENES